MLWFQKAEVAELVDALDSGSSGMYVLWGFKSPLRHQPSSFIVVEARIEARYRYWILEFRFSGFGLRYQPCTAWCSGPASSPITV